MIKKFYGILRGDSIMIPAKIDPIFNTNIREKGVESIVTWFDQHLQSFYALGLSYLNNQQQMEELFYRSIIKIHKELSRFKSKTSFETWVTSIFMHVCREIADDTSLQASENREPRQDFLIALDQLKEQEKDVIVLTYVKGLSYEETAQLLQISVERMKELLFSGIKSLRKELGYGSSFNGCKEYHKNYIDYFERTLDRSKKIDFEIHIYHCQDCQEDLATFQDVMLTLVNFPDRIGDLQIPSSFIQNIKHRLAERENHRQHKIRQRKRKGLIFAGVFALLIGIEVISGAFTHLYYTWTEEDPELRAYLQEDLGERLNLEAESNGVKVKIKSVVADDVQTLVFYEIEDTDKKNQYMMNYDDGIFVENEREIMSHATYPRFYPPNLESKVNKEKSNVYQGKISLFPLKTDNGTIKLKVTKLMRLIIDSSKQYGLGADPEFQTGEWSFEIPVTKQPSTEYALDENTAVAGVPVRFDKITIAPTTTILQYGINNEKPEKMIETLNFDHLEVNNTKVKADKYGSSFIYSQQWATFQAHFEPLFGEKPKEINVQLESAHLTIEDPKIIELDPSRGYPQTFEYASSTISIDKVEVGQPTIVVISNHDIKNRAYEVLNFNIVGEDENEIESMEMDAEGVLLDKNGTEYDMYNPVSYREIEQPRYFLTVQNIRLHSINAGEKVIPKRLEIYGYNTTKYLDDVVGISLD